MNAMEWADRNLKSLGDFDAFVCGDRRWRSSALHERVMRTTSGLRAMGLAPGDRVLLWLPNGAELVIAWRAVLRAGGVSVVAHHDSPPARIEQLADETQAVAIVSASPAAASARIRIAAGAELERLAAGHPPLAEPVPRADGDIALLQYTSGTTGTPKGVVTRHGALLAWIKARRRRFAGWRRPARILSVLPMSGAMGSSPLYDGLARRCTHFVIDRFDPEELLAAIERHKIERTFLVPAMCEAILAVPDLRRFDLSSLATVTSGGAVVSAALIERFEAKLGIRIQVIYGMTGVGGVSTTSPASKPGSVGRIARQFRAQVVDPQGRPIAPGEIGELWLDRQVEYWPHGSTAPASDGWYRTGDLARIDADGELTVVGRNDDLIIQGGHNVNAHTVADVIERLPQVKECAVVGVASEFLGQEVVACVALRAGARLAAEDIIAHCRKHLEALAVPTRIRFLAALPRNEAGKIKSFELRDALSAAAGTVQNSDLVRRLAAAPAAERRALLRQEIEARLAAVLRREPGKGETFSDRGLDSLGAVELTHALSDALGRPVPATLAYSHPTVDAACDLLMQLLGWSAPTSAAPPPDVDDLRLDAFLAPDELAAVAPPTPPQPARVLFLTGANGFLGRFIALEVLARLPSTARLYCLVRANSNSVARQRLRDGFQTSPDLRDRIDRELETGRLIVMAGDLTQPRLGLTDDDYSRMCAEVDHIVHAGARVDHVLGYDALHAPNVLGTVEIIRLALRRRIKPIHYVSTVATLGPKGGTAAGYALTKSASEALLKDLHRRLGAPVRIYRPSQILGHSEAAGQINAADTFTRLLHGLVTTALAPGSFYASAAAAFDGLSVDVVAGTIAAASLADLTDEAGWSEVDIVNPQRGVTLDTIVDWVRTAGYPVERIDDYRAWYAAFGSRLNSLSRRERQRSLLPLLPGWEKPRRPGSGPAGSPPRFAPLNEAFIHKCLADMRLLGLIGPPP